MKKRSGQTDRIPDFNYKAMLNLYKLTDPFISEVKRRLRLFDIQPGMTVIDYGCGPGRYTPHFARLVGPRGRVYAVDTQEQAIAIVQGKVEKERLENVIPILSQGYKTDLPPAIADRIYALDMFCFVSDTNSFLRELRRLVKNSGRLIIDSEHMQRATALHKIRSAGCWEIVAEQRAFITCKPAASQIKE
jgi:ubiquinone/menaquinone biosynthesis C-methylase UbiE